VKLLLSMKFWIFDSHWSVGDMTIVLPLSARVVIAPFSVSLLGMDLILLLSGYVLCVGVFCVSVLIRSATNFLYTSLSESGVGIWLFLPPGLGF